jgi:oligopeptide/dipeptide ABC transporter ATP-binding protein
VSEASRPAGPEAIAERGPLEPLPSFEQPLGAVLSVRDLHVEFPTDDGLVKAVDGLSYDVYANEVLGIVGESGSGKSVSSLAILGLLPKRARIRGQIVYRGREVLGLPEREMLKLRGESIAMVFQDALAALNPVYTVGAQIGEAVKVHHPDLSKAEIRARAIELLELVGTPSPTKRIDNFPHEFSGGMRQRAMIAMALANDPDVLIADEPTTALDVTIQAQVLDVIERVQERTSSAIVLITHDLGVVAGVADRVMVMYAGRQAEVASVDEVFYETRHPYTLGLLASLPRLDQDAEGMRLHRIKGQPPSLIDVPPGCPFHPRCEFRRLPEPCATDVPLSRPMENPEHLSACHFAEELRDTQPEDLQPVAKT